MWSDHPNIPHVYRMRYLNMPYNYTMTPEESKWMTALANALPVSSVDTIDMPVLEGIFTNDATTATAVAMMNQEIANVGDADTASLSLRVNALLTLKAVFQQLTMAENLLQTPGLNRLRAWTTIPNGDYSHYILAKYDENKPFDQKLLAGFPVVASVLNFAAGIFRTFVDNNGLQHGQWTSFFSPVSAALTPKGASQADQRALDAQYNDTIAKYSDALSKQESYKTVSARLQAIVKKLGLDLYLLGRLESLVQAYANTAGAVISIKDGDGVATLKSIMRNGLPQCANGTHLVYVDADGKPVDNPISSSGGGIVQFKDNVRGGKCVPKIFLGGAIMRASRRRANFAADVMGYSHMMAHLSNHPPRQAVISVLSRMNTTKRRPKYSQGRGAVSRSGYAPRDSKGRYLPRMHAVHAPRSSSVPAAYRGHRGAPAAAPRDSKGRYLPRTGSKSRYRACTAAWA